MLDSEDFAAFQGGCITPGPGTIKRAANIAWDCSGNLQFNWRFRFRDIIEANVVGEILEMFHPITSYDSNCVVGSHVASCCGARGDIQNIYTARRDDGQV